MATSFLVKYLSGVFNTIRHDLTRFDFFFLADKNGFKGLQGPHITAYEWKSSSGLGVWGRGVGGEEACTCTPERVPTGASPYEMSRTLYY